MADKMQYEVLNWASLFLEKNNREPHVAEILLQHHLNVNRTQFFIQMRDSIPQSVVEVFEADIREHVKTGKPVQHFTGYEYFYGRKFHVNEQVLIPRPETEELVQHVIENNKLSNPTIIDVGTGSGIIAITLALECPNATVYATDISKEALAVTKKNSRNLQADVIFLQGDFLQPAIERDIKADIIISNPPYISEVESQQLSDTVKNFDPSLALFAEENGLAAYKDIIIQASSIINNRGMLAFEIGHKQGKAVSELIKKQYSNTSPTVIKDINGKDRIVIATLD